EHVGVKILGASVTAGPSADGMGLVDDKKCAVLAGEISKSFMESAVGQNDADIGERRFCQHASDITMGERRLKRVEVVELDDASRLGGIHSGAAAASTGLRSGVTGN